MEWSARKAHRMVDAGGTSEGGEGGEGLHVVDDSLPPLVDRSLDVCLSAASASSSSLALHALQRGSEGEKATPVDAEELPAEWFTWLTKLKWLTEIVRNNFLIGKCKSEKIE